MQSDHDREQPLGEGSAASDLVGTGRGVNTGVAPATYGEGDRTPRGDYAGASRDYTCEQHWERYSRQEHALYRRLFERQAAKLEHCACPEFIEAVEQLGTPTHIPRFSELSEGLREATGWEIVAVPGLIPEEAFFSLLSKRKFPVTRWIRNEEEFDYVVEPDVFHDLFGHVPLLFNPTFADFMQAYGAGGLKATGLDACRYLARLYWYTVEFGLILTSDGLRAYGAGVLSSASELKYSVSSETPQRLGFDVERIMRTRYKIDDFQATYFVIESFDELFEATSPDFTPLYESVYKLCELPAGARLATDRLTDLTGRARPTSR